AHEFDHSAIVYAGDLYPPKRTLTPVLAALRHLKTTQPASAPPWRLHYYGRMGDQIRKDAERFGLCDEVILHGSVPRQQALAAVAGAGVAVVVTSISRKGSLEDRGIVTGKLFEALGLGTRTLLIAPDDSDAENILETSNLGCRFSGDDTEGIAAFLSAAMCNRIPERSA